MAFPIQTLPQSVSLASALGHLGENSEAEVTERLWRSRPPETSVGHELVSSSLLTASFDLVVQVGDSRLAFTLSQSVCLARPLICRPPGYFGSIFISTPPASLQNIRMFLCHLSLAVLFTLGNVQ
jgi:hypothetical protein